MIRYANFQVSETLLNGVGIEALIRSRESKEPEWKRSDEKTSRRTKKEHASACQRHAKHEG
jgi:hypothetical protein